MLSQRNTAQFDVAIVGAGPAGSVAAQQLASAGVRVLLLERTAFPRDKACGDGVSAAGLAVLARTGLGEWASQFPAPETLRLAAPNGQVLDMQPRADTLACYGRTIPRRLLDAQLAQAAVNAGARLMEKRCVQNVELANGAPPVIIAQGLKTSAQLVILADGSNAPITRRLGLSRNPPELVAVRQYFRGYTGPSERLEVHFQREIIPGYTWLFPTGGGRVNVGTGTFIERVRRNGVNLRKTLSCFVNDPTVAEGRLARAEPAGSIRGHSLRTRLNCTQTHAERVLVAGDAAGLVNPLSGEGIAAALESGEIAAAHALSALSAGDFSAQALAPYTQALKNHYGADQRAARILRLAMNSPWLLNHIFGRLQQDQALALLVGYVIIGYKSPRQVLHPATLLRLLF